MRTRALTLVAVIGVSALASAQTPSVGPGQRTPTRLVAIGCLTKQVGATVEGRTAPAQYVVTDARGDRPTLYRLTGDRELFEQHVGHAVEVSGAIDPSTGASTRPVLKVSSLVYVARTCKK